MFVNVPSAAKWLAYATASALFHAAVSLLMMLRMAAVSFAFWANAGTASRPISELRKTTRVNFAFVMVGSGPDRVFLNTVRQLNVRSVKIQRNFHAVFYFPFRHPCSVRQGSILQDHACDRFVAGFGSRSLRRRADNTTPDFARYYRQLSSKIAY